MRVAIAGGHGKIALRLTRLLRAGGDDVRSLIRRPEHAGDIRAADAQPVVCDLEAASPDEVADAMAPVDAVVFAAGAGPGSGAARKDTMDYGGAAKLIAAARIAGIQRYVMVSSIGADAQAEGSDTFAAYIRAKGRADDELIASGLDHTIIRPARLTDDPGAGTVELGVELKRRPISRDDVAAILAIVLHTPATIGKSFEATGGAVPIEEAIRRLG